MAYFIASRFPLASWDSQVLQGREGFTNSQIRLTDSKVSERKEPGIELGLCSDFLCDSPALFNAISPSY